MSFCFCCCCSCCCCCCCCCCLFANFWLTNKYMLIRVYFTLIASFIDDNISSFTEEAVAADDGSTAAFSTTINNNNNSYTHKPITRPKPLICERCHSMQHHSHTLPVSLPKDDYKNHISEFWRDDVVVEDSVWFVVRG